MNEQAEFDFSGMPRKEATAAVLERIKKLLRLGRSTNPHEAELAMQRAFVLAEKYRVDVGELDLDDDEAAVAHEWFDVGQRLSFLKKRALNIVVQFFHVDVCLSAPRVVFIGRPADIAIAHYVFEFLIGACTRCLRTYESGERAARRKINHGKRTNFIQGFIYGIAEKLKASRQTLVLTDSQTALVVAEKAAREHYLGELIPNTKQLRVENGSRRNLTALEAGYRDGKATNLNQPLHGRAVETLLLT